MTEAGETPPERHYKPDPNASTGKLFAFNRPTVIVLFYLATYFTIFSSIVGVVLAYIWRGEPHEEWEASHYAYLIRTFWISILSLPVGLVGFLVALAAGSENSAAGITIGGLLALLFLAITVLLLVRCFRSLMRAQAQEAMPNPKSWLV